MSVYFAPLRALQTRLAAVVWTRRGRRALACGDVFEGVQALEQAVSWRPRALKPLLRLAVAYFRAREIWQAHRTLARAREAHPSRFARVAPRLLSREGVDPRILGSDFGADALGPPSEARVPAAARMHSARPAIGSANLPYGDCRDLDEYARFRAMPPISQAEIETTDWDRILEDLLDEGA